MGSKTLNTPTKPKVILITGGTGAGKTTYARGLCDDIGAVRFSIDDWMTGLFWMDAPEGGATFEWAMERIGRVESLIRLTAEQTLSRGLPVVLDLGFTKSTHRKAFADWAETLDAPCELHWVDVPAETRWSRVEGRNTEQGETFAMTVTRDMFDFMEAEWEAPSEAERDDKMVIRRV